MKTYIINSHRVGKVGEVLEINHRITDKIIDWLLKAGFISEAPQAPVKSAKTEPKQQPSEE